MRVLDQNEIEFSLEKLSDCYLWEARKILNCQKKILSERETAFLISKDKLNIFAKSDFYIQKISLLQDFRNGEDDLYLFENIVAEFCNGINKIRENDWWLYAARRRSDLRIIAGIGKGIILSRFLSLDSDASEEISKTATYLQRFGMQEIKFFSSEINLQIGSKINCKRIFIERRDDVENFLSNNGKIKPIINSKNRLEKFLNCEILSAVSLVLILILFGIDERCKDKEKTISSLQESVRVATKDMELKINNDNFSFVKQIVNALKDSRNPLESLKKASKLHREYDFQIERLSLENGAVKIKTSLSKSTFEKLKSLRDVAMEKISNDEYEELGSNKKIGAVICIK
jgi:hypothetical protein